ncbi:MAG: ScbR family autoregulator-binding transcription factor [Leifsonia sp.]
MTQQQRAQVTRDRALEGAAAVFARLGYAAASLTDISAETGVSKGSLYFHFRSKEDLARAIVAREQELGKESAERVIAAAASSLEATMGLCADFARHMATNQFARAGARLTTETTTFDPPLRGPFEDWIVLIGTLLTGAAAEGDLRTDVDPAVIAHFVIPAFTGVQMASAVLTDYADLVLRVREMWTVVLPGMVRPERLDAALASLDRVLPLA